MIIDTHCHIYEEKLNDIRKDILKNLETKPQIAICCGDNLVTSKLSLDLANANKNIFCAVGVHPHEAKNVSANFIDELKNLAQNKKVVAIGEIGLDYYYELSDKETQKQVLKKQIKLADELGLPCIFHVREATKDFIDILTDMAQNLNNLGVIHSFSGSLETANIYLKHNFYLGINGIITFKNASNTLEIVKNIPLEKMVIETDSPYLSPVPYRGQPNRPEYVELVAMKIAEIKNLTLEEVLKVTTANAKKLFRLDIN